MKSPFPQFTTYRDFQETVIDQVLQSDRKVTFIDGPPGSGKSIIGMSLAYQREHSLYLCITKPLQVQIHKDFPAYPILMGRSNYPCNYSNISSGKFPEVTCEDCVGGKEIKRQCASRCAYEKQKRLCLASGISILNTTYFLTEANMVGGFSGKDLIVVDECDRLEDSIVRFIEFNINERNTIEFGFDMPSKKTILGWKKWAETVLPNIIKMVSGVELWINPNSPREDVRGLKQLKSLLRKVNVLKTYLDDSWVYQEEAGRYGISYNFKPVWISQFAKGFIWDHAQRFVLMSGSIFPERKQSVPPATIISGKSGMVTLDMADALGLEPKDWDYIEIPNQFPAERRPITYFPVANLTAKTMVQEQELLVKPVKDIIDKYPDSKGLIHSVSYRLNEFMMFRIQNKRLVSHVSGIGQREALLEEFKQSQKPLVMMSPSMDRGIDLPYDLCRFIIILKVPYPNLGDKQIASRVRSKNGNRWYGWTTVCSIVQASMRGMRSVDDGCDCVIPDSKVLTSDLIWEEAGSIKIGDNLLAFDEFSLTQPMLTKRPGWHKGGIRKWRWSTVLGILHKKAKCYRIHLSNGETVTCTGDHKWIVRLGNKKSDWRDTLHLERPHGIKKYHPLIRIVNSWISNNSWKCGWLAGFFDGEGCLVLGQGKRNRHVPRLMVTQKIGPTMDIAKQYIREMGFSYREQINNRNISQLTINGGFPELLRFLGQVRPERLRPKLNDGQNLVSFQDIDIEAIEVVGVKDIVVMQTSTGTFISDGFAAHNCWILDSQFGRFFSKHEAIFPEWWKESLEEVEWKL